jgi:hypothetical protein
VILVDNVPLVKWQTALQSAWLAAVLGFGNILVLSWLRHP